MRKIDELREGTITRATDDEPVFVLRGQDKLAPEVIRNWATRAGCWGVNDEKIQEALKFADEMEQWQGENGCKLPD